MIPECVGTNLFYTSTVCIKYVDVVSIFSQSGAEDLGMARCSFPVDEMGVDENGTPMAQGFFSGKMARKLGEIS